MIATTKEGRHLLIHAEGVDAPFVIPPLPGLAGVQITGTYLGGIGGIGTAEDLAGALMMAVDGATRDPETGQWSPLPPEKRANFDRIGMELSQAEAEDVMSAAFFWQSALGMDGVRAFVESGGGVAGSLRAMSALKARTHLLDRRKEERA